MGNAIYLWRKLTAKEQEELLGWRKQRELPWHRPPHRASEKTRYHLTAACFEHRQHIGQSRKRMELFCGTLLEIFTRQGAQIHAWCVLPNHYHALISTIRILEVLAALGQMHGRLSFCWNGEEQIRGRQVWCGAVERYMRSDSRFWATLNYVHHNPVRHGYVERWTDWPWSSGKSFLQMTGFEEAKRIWRDYPIREYGKEWDEPRM